MVKLNHLRDHDDPDEEEATPQSSVNRPPVKPGMSRTGHLVAATLLSVAAFAPGCVNTVQAPCPPSPCAGPDAGTQPEKKTTRPLTRRTKSRGTINKTLRKPLDERSERRTNDDRLWEPLDPPRKAKKCPSDDDLSAPLDLPAHCKKCPSDDDLSAPLDLPAHCRKRSKDDDGRL